MDVVHNGITGPNYCLNNQLSFWTLSIHISFVRKKLKAIESEVVIKVHRNIVILSFGFSKIITNPMEIAIENKKHVSDDSHELKTPLSIIKINSTLLKNKPIDYEYLDEINMQIDRMSNLINDLLVLAKLENYNERIEFYEFDLSKTLLHSILQLEVIAYEHNKKIIYDIEEDIMYKGIEKDMRSMMEALIDNAIKYSYE